MNALAGMSNADLLPYVWGLIGLGLICAGVLGYVVASFLNRKR